MGIENTEYVNLNLNNNEDEENQEDIASNTDTRIVKKLL